MEDICWLSGPGGARCPPTPDLRASVTPLMRSGPDIFANRRAAHLPISLPRRGGRECGTPGALCVELLMGQRVRLACRFGGGRSCAASVSRETGGKKCWCVTGRILYFPRVELLRVCCSWSADEVQWAKTAAPTVQLERPEMLLNRVSHAAYNNQLWMPNSPKN